MKSKIFFIIVAIALGIYFTTSCTISFQNISTHGTATDLVDENQTATPKIDTKISVIPNG